MKIFQNIDESLSITDLCNSKNFKYWIQSGGFENLTKLLECKANYTLKLFLIELDFIKKIFGLKFNWSHLIKNQA